MEEGTLSMAVTLPVGHKLQLELPVDGSVLAGGGVLVLTPRYTWCGIRYKCWRESDLELHGCCWLRAGERNASSESVLLRRWSGR